MSRNLANAFAATIALALSASLISSCANGDGTTVYQGMIEADTVLVSARSSGEIEEMRFEEGSLVADGGLMAKIDSEAQEIMRRQNLARIDELALQKESALAQIDQAELQLALNRETYEKTRRLLDEGGATRQRVDELATQVEVNESNLEILRSNYRIILSREQELQAGIDLIDLEIRNTSIIAPVSGTVVNRYRNAGEMVAAGSPLYELADLSRLDVYIYVPLNELSAIGIGQAAFVTVDGMDEPVDGTVEWIADEGEFTPKTILTRDTRETLVYEVRIAVDNAAGRLKIGMPADVRF
jgi:HlyD family secretion protein